MGVRFECPNGHKLNVKAHLAGERGICPECGAKFVVPGFSGGRVDEAPSANDSAVALEMSFSDAPGFKSSAGSAVDAAVAWYVRPTSGGQYGPVDTNEFKQWVADGRVAATAWVWRTGWADWKSGAEALQTFVPEKPRAPTPPPPPLTPRVPVAPVSRAPVTPPVAAATKPQPQAEPTFDLGDDWPPAVTSNGAQLPAQLDGLQAARRRQRQFNQRLTLILGVVAMILLVVLVIVLSRPTETTDSPETGATINEPAEAAATPPAEDAAAAESTPAEEAGETP